MITLQNAVKTGDFISENINCFTAVNDVFLRSLSDEPIDTVEVETDTTVLVTFCDDSSISLPFDIVVE